MVQLGGFTGLLHTIVKGIQTPTHPDEPCAVGGVDCGEEGHCRGTSQGVSFWSNAGSVLVLTVEEGGTESGDRTDSLTEGPQGLGQEQISKEERRQSRQRGRGWV